MANNFERYNNIIGWVLFVAATVLYICTLEPSVSLWDCGEWITVVHGLQVGHPPGAPLYVLLAKVFSFLAANDVSRVAFYVNMLSAVSSGAAVMFLYWTSSYFLKQMFSKLNKDFKFTDFVFLASAVVGASVFAVSDSFWYSAVESEVYALSSFFSSLLFWCITKWHRCEVLPERWLLLIVFLLGVSFAVHNLSLLVIPAIVLFYCCKKYAHWNTMYKLLFSLFIGVLLLAVVFLFFIPGFFYLMAATSLWLVNSFECSVIESVGIYYLVVFGVLGVFCAVSVLLKNTKLHIIAISLILLVLGLSLQLVTMFCSMADTPINENEPNNPQALYSYIQRSQYEKAPLIYGPYYTAPFERYEDGDEERKLVYLMRDAKGNVLDTCFTNIQKERYITDADVCDIEAVPKYIVVNGGRNTKVVLDDEFQTFFPRMWKYGESFAYNYYSWTPGAGTFIELDGNQVYKPSFTDNMSFFMSYQLGYMYFRYLMWNFVGKSDGGDDRQNKDWISGIRIIDEWFGNEITYDSPDGKAETCTYFMLPLMLALLGLIFQMYKDSWNALVVVVLFFLTGIAVVVYLNQPAYEPRERDYVYLMSFYSFSLWVSLGAGCGCYLLQKIKMFRSIIATVVIFLLLMAVPGMVLSENWNSHNRSEQYISRDMAYNILQSCQPNAVLFTGGDNDTFPLWYLQQVEGVRTDVRVVNLSLLSIPWYIEQLRGHVCEVDTVKLSLKSVNYCGNSMELLFTSNLRDEMSLCNMMSYLADSCQKVVVDNMPDFYLLPTNEVYIDVNDSVIGRQRRVNIELPHIITKSVLAHLDVVNSNYFRRPIYYTNYAIDESHFLKGYVQMEGMAYRLNLNEQANYRPVNIDVMECNVMEKFRWGSIDNNNYANEAVLEMINSILLANIAEWSNACTDMNDTDRVKKMWNLILDSLPMYWIYSEEVLDAIDRAGKLDNADL